MARLRPGMSVVRRDAGHLQVGVDAPARAIVADTAAVRRLLEDLAVGAPAAPETPEAHLALRDLDAAGLVVQVPPKAPPIRVAVSADDATLQACRRHLHPIGAELVDVGTCDVPVLLVVAGELSRARVDPLVRDGIPHLPLTVSGGELVLGPFVDAGASPCMRCVDAHLTEVDPRRPTIVEQLARLPLPVAVDPLAEATALPWALRDLVTYARGYEPSTWGATYTFGPGPAPVRREWTRHPYCGCGWDQLLA